MRVVKVSGHAVLAVAILAGCAIWVYRWTLLILAIAIAAIVYEKRKNRERHCKCPSCREIDAGVRPQVYHYNRQHWHQ